MQEMIFRSWRKISLAEMLSLKLLSPIKKVTDGLPYENVPHTLVAFGREKHEKEFVSRAGKAEIYFWKIPCSSESHGFPIHCF